MVCKLCRKKAERSCLCSDCFVKVGVKIAEALGGPEEFGKAFNKFNSLSKEEVQKYLDEKGMTDEKAYSRMRELLKITKPS